MTTVIYNVLMVIADVVSLAILSRKRTTLSLLKITLATVTVAGVLAIILRENGFGMIRLFAYGFFLHGFVIFTGATVLFRKTSRWTSISCAACSILFVLIAIDAFLVEPTCLKISHLQIQSLKLRNHIKIAVVADLQTDVIGDYEREVLQATMQEKPDLILMPGDYIQEHNSERRRELNNQLRSLLREVNFIAPLGIYAVAGNNDSEDWTDIFEGLPVTVIDKTRTIKVKEIQLTALDLEDSTSIGLHYDDAPLKNIPETEQFHIVFGHCPDFALGKVGADLLIAGHTHGGQVQLPFIGPLLVLSKVPREWASGVTYWGKVFRGPWSGAIDLRGGRMLVVSRGIGMERGYAPRMRFLCKPELVIIDLFPFE